MEFASRIFVGKRPKCPTFVADWREEGHHCAPEEPSTACRKPEILSHASWSFRYRPTGLYPSREPHEFNQPQFNLILCNTNLSRFLPLPYGGTACGGGLMGKLPEIFQLILVDYQPMFWYSLCFYACRVAASITSSIHCNILLHVLLLTSYWGIIWLSANTPPTILYDVSFSMFLFAQCREGRVTAPPFQFLFYLMFFRTISHAFPQRGIIFSLSTRKPLQRKAQ